MQVELRFREETTDTVVQSASELAEMDGVVAILGPLFSSHAVKVGPVIIFRYFWARQGQR